MRACIMCGATTIAHPFCSFTCELDWYWPLDHCLDCDAVRFIAPMIGYVPRATAEQERQHIHH